MQALLAVCPMASTAPTQSCDSTRDAIAKHVPMMPLAQVLLKYASMSDYIKIEKLGFCAACASDGRLAAASAPDGAAEPHIVWTENVSACLNCHA